jgi:SAM-dependent methyltransferase
MRSSFFSNTGEDEQLEVTNSAFWDSLIDHIREDCTGAPPHSLLDVGCHYGGLLARLVSIWQARCVWGIEPMKAARLRATARLGKLAPEVRFVDNADWAHVPAMTFDLVTCHEVLYFEPDLHAFMVNVERVMSRSGRLYVVLGCHAENPVWAVWKPQLEAIGHRVYDHRPMDILAAGAKLGLVPSLRPLRRTGWITHDPTRSEFSFPSAGVMVDHHFKHKLLFRFMRP